MKSIIKLSLFTVLVFAGIMTLFMVRMNGDLFSSSFLTGLLLLFILWLLFVFLLYSMGRPPDVGTVLVSREPVTVVRRGGMPRKWVSAALVCEGSDRIAVYVFGKEKCRIGDAGTISLSLTDTMITVSDGVTMIELTGENTEQYRKTIERCIGKTHESTDCTAH